MMCIVVTREGGCGLGQNKYCGELAVLRRRLPESMITTQKAEKLKKW